MYSACVFQLELEGISIEEGTSFGGDPQFLMEVMEINEALDGAQNPEEANKIGQDTKGKQILHVCFVYWVKVVKWFGLIIN